MGVEFTEGMITTMIGYITTLFSDLDNLLLLILGVGLGLIIISAIISAIRGH